MTIPCCARCSNWPWSLRQTFRRDPLVKGLFCLASAEQVHELITVVAREELAIGLPKIVHARAESEVCRLARLAMHIEQNRLDRTDLPVY